MPDHFLAFLGVAGLLTLTPGPDMALVLRNGVRGGSRAAWWTGLGCCTGIAGYALITAVGLAAVLAASDAAFTVIKVAGAAYLVYLGARALWAASAGGSEPAVEPEIGVTGGSGAAMTSRREAFRQGLVSNLLNPKIALIFLTLIPQFVTAEDPAYATGVLAVAFLAMAVLWWRVFSLAVGALGRLMARERVRRAIEGLTGVVLIGLGVRMALQR
ncbi:LysE family translocator [Nocardioides sambongensis]|uniref:LysE family translocator n=1 Tax=Nocardioides sambongensis TaxID=2589074 RepID=UPI00112AA707|nr:LysE family translocator [Nocardioides sambongensis]